MEYLITFLEGIISFISPCMLPMLPIYISYFAGEANKKSKTFLSALSFVLGFTVVFSIVGLFAGTIGEMLQGFHQVVDIASGIIIVLLGLNFLDIINIPFLKGFHASHKVTGILSAFVFGVVFSISHAPCLGAFLGAAIVSASASGSTLKGMFLLISYSIGMGIPFLISALVIDKLSPAFSAIQRNYRVINLICGILLIILGICMATGLLHEFLHIME